MWHSYFFRGWYESRVGGYEQRLFSTLGVVEKELTNPFGKCAEESAKSHSLETESSKRSSVSKIDAKWL